MVTPKTNQFGGEKGCGTDRFLVSVLDYVTAALEDNRPVVVISSIDFSKAFNRLVYQVLPGGLCQKRSVYRPAQIAGMLPDSDSWKIILE